MTDEMPTQGGSYVRTPDGLVPAKEFHARPKPSTRRRPEPVPEPDPTPTPAEE